MKKYKILLSAFIDYPNAQNINCKFISKYLNKDIFQVHTMYFDKKKIEDDLKSIYFHKIIQHRFVYQIMYFFNLFIRQYDIYYLPKGEKLDMIFIKLFGRRKCIVTTIEGVIKFEKDSPYSELRKQFTDIGSISKDIAGSIKKFWNIDARVLYLGCEKSNFDRKIKYRINNIFYVGNIKSNKCPLLFVKVAEKFPKINFHMIGDGDQFNLVKEYIYMNNIINIKLYGRLANRDVINSLFNADLLLITSEYEGLPKVILEAQSMGVPCIYLNENYKVDYIIDNLNGYGVASLDFMIDKIINLIHDPLKLYELSINSYETSEKYTWNKLILDWEEFFINAYNNKMHKS